VNNSTRIGVGCAAREPWEAVVSARANTSENVRRIAPILSARAATAAERAKSNLYELPAPHFWI
jgi:hypothetical protein